MHMARSASTKAAVEYDELFDEAMICTKKRPPVCLKWGASFHHWLVMIIIPALKSQFVYTPLYCVLHFQKHPLKNMRAPQVSAARCTAGA